MEDKLTIKELTAAIDLGAKDLWSSFGEEQRKSISFFLMNRYASSIKTGNRDAQELAVFKTNEYFNKHYFSLSKEHSLLWYLLCMCGNEEKNIYFHEWIGFKKKGTDDKLIKALETIFPEKKYDEIELLSKMVDKKDIQEYAKDLGMSDEEIKKLI